MGLPQNVFLPVTPTWGFPFRGTIPILRAPESQKYVEFWPLSGYVQVFLAIVLPTFGVQVPVTPIWGFPKIRGTIFGVIILRITKDHSIWGSTLGSPYLGTLPFAW